MTALCLGRNPSTCFFLACGGAGLGCAWCGGAVPNHESEHLIKGLL